MARGRQLAGGGRAVEVAPDRVAGWFERFAERHGGAAQTRLGACAVEVAAGDGSTARVEVPFGGLDRDFGAVDGGAVDGLAVAPLVEHVNRTRRIGLVLVRKGAHSVGISRGPAVERSSTDRHLVHGRTKAGGWSQQRYARRRAGEARRALDAAADAVARVLLPHREELDAVVLGGDRQALEALRSDSRIGGLLAAAEPRVLDVPEPRRAVLDEAARRAVAVEIGVWES